MTVVTVRAQGQADLFPLAPYVGSDCGASAFQKVGEERCLLKRKRDLIAKLSHQDSPENIELKKRLYFEEAAQEVWICGLEGQMEFFSPTGELAASKLCSKFPKRILTSHERLDLEQQKEISRKAARATKMLERPPQRDLGEEPPASER